MDLTRKATVKSGAAAKTQYFPFIVNETPFFFTAAMFVYGDDSRCRLFLHFLSLWTHY